MNFCNRSIFRTVFAVGCTVLCLLSSTGCESNPDGLVESSPELRTSYIDSSVTQHQNLGWLGAMANPVLESISLMDPDDPEASGQSVSPGGIVIREITANGIASESGLLVGDVILRVGENWLPIKDDPTIDFMIQLEDVISSGEVEVTLGILRNGAYSTMAIRHGLASLDEGMPGEVARIKEASQLALNHLAKRQNDDGSFGGTKLNDIDRAKVTAIAGLSLIGAGDSQFVSQVGKCKEFLGTVIDQHKVQADQDQETGKPQTEKQDPPGGMMVAPAIVKLDPLTTAYVMQFLAESDVQMMQGDWMPRIMGMIGNLAGTQAKSGAWNVQTVNESDEEIPEVLDLPGTHTTNQVLMALGAWESKGLMAQPESIAKACGFLSRQYELRVKQAKDASGMDRRVRAALAAGSAAALLALNCESSDLLFRQMADEALDRATDVVLAPGLGSSGLVCAALVARGGDKQEWSRFIRSVRIRLLQSLAADGRFHPPAPVKTDQAPTYETDLAWQSALFAITLGMQQGNLQRLTGVATSPMQVSRNSAGEKTDGSSSAQAGMPDMPSGGTKMMTLTLDDLSGEGSMEDQIKEKLKEMGMDTENIQFGESGNLPGAGESSSGKKKDKKKDKK